MKFSTVQTNKVSPFIINEDLRRFVSTMVFVILFIGVVFVAAFFSAVVAIALGVVVIFIIFLYTYYTSNIFSYIDYFTITGNIEFNETELKVNAEEFSYQALEQIKIFINFYKNSTLGRYSNLSNGINKIEFYYRGEQRSFEFMIHSKNEYIKFEKMLIRIKSQHIIRIFDARKDTLALPVY